MAAIRYIFPPNTTSLQNSAGPEIEIFLASNNITVASLLSHFLCNEAGKNLYCLPDKSLYRGKRERRPGDKANITSTPPLYDEGT